jgi:predicted MFS family arabinose efflux permease
MASRSREEIRIVACLFLVLFIGVADNQILSPLLPAIRTQFGKSSSEMAYLFTGYSFCAGLSVLIWGPLSDAFGRKRGLLYGLTIFTAGSVISFFSPSFAVLLAGRILTGMGASMLSLNSISYAGDFFPYENRGWAMGFIMSSYFAALILGIPFGSWISDRLGWKMVFGSLGAIALVLTVLIQWLLPVISPQKESGSGLPATQYIGQYIGFLKKRSSIGALLCSLFASGGTMGFLAFLGTWLHDSFGVPTGKIGLVFLASGPAALLASPLAGSIADKIGKRLQFILSSMALALFLCILPGLNWGWVLFMVFGCISLSAAFRQGPMEAVLTEIVGPESRGTFVALKNSFSQLGIGLTTLVSGILFEIHGYRAVCILGAGLSLLATAGMFLTFRERRL